MISDTGTFETLSSGTLQHNNGILLRRGKGSQTRGEACGRSGSRLRPAKEKLRPTKEIRFDLFSIT